MNPYLYRLYQQWNAARISSERLAWNHRYARSSTGRIYRRYNEARTSAERTAYQIDELRKGH